MFSRPWLLTDFSFSAAPGGASAGPIFSTLLGFRSYPPVPRDKVVEAANVCRRLGGLREGKGRSEGESDDFPPSLVQRRLLMNGDTQTHSANASPCLPYDSEAEVCRAQPEEPLPREQSRRNGKRLFVSSKSGESNLTLTLEVAILKCLKKTVLCPQQEGLPHRIFIVRRSAGAGDVPATSTGDLLTAR